MAVARPVRDALRRASPGLGIGAAILALYLGPATVLRGAEVPSEAFWAPWRVPFVLLLVAAICVPLYALYTTIDARIARRYAELDKDLDVSCQEVAMELADHCEDLRINDIAVQIWSCRPDGFFDRHGRFLLPKDRKSSNVIWQKGKGVAGKAWETGKDVGADLRGLHQQRRELGKAAFDALDEEQRFGMTYDELERTDVYSGIAVRPLFSTDGRGTLLGVCIVDYMGADAFPCVAEAFKGRRVSAPLQGAQRRLTAAVEDGLIKRPA